MKPKLILAALVVAVATIVTPATAGATPAEQACRPNSFRQHDMAGTYEGPDIRVVVYACGDVSVVWSNRFGSHAAAYVGFDRLAGNGIMTLGAIPDRTSLVYMDSSDFLGIKAGSPGWVEVVTYGPSPDIYNMPVKAIYRLQKLN